MSQKMASRWCYCNFSTLPAVDQFWYLSEQNDSGHMPLYTICCLRSLVFIPTVNRNVLVHGSKQKHYHTHKYFPELEIALHWKEIIVLWSVWVIHLQTSLSTTHQVRPCI
jgi:hypothetical protein